MKGAVKTAIILATLLASGCQELPHVKQIDVDTDSFAVEDDNNSSNIVLQKECDEETAVERCGSPLLCVDGYCCNTVCTGDCEACNLPGAEGICVPLTNDVVCRPAAGDCDPAETCDGASGVCPAVDIKSTAICRDAAGVCDTPELCDGVHDDCPAEDLKSTDICRAAAGACDLPEVCDGANDDCPEEDLKSTDICRATAGECDLPESCDGVSDDCPAIDAKSTAVCRNIAGVCDVVEVCDGVSNDCPAVDAKSTDICRAEAGMCDVPEVCDGVNDDCPAADAKSTDVCRAAAGVCDTPEACDGANDDCPAVDTKSTHVCRPAAGTCDLPETCDGVSDDCPATDAKLTGVCRAAAGVCDTSEVCDGISDDCPAVDTKSTAVCRAAAGVCDVSEFCDGVNDDCPPVDAKKTDVCRAAAGVCDLQEVCDGVNDDCPPVDAKKTEICRAAAGACDLPEYCDGTNDDCPVWDDKSTDICRPAAGDCDIPDYCDGASDDCPAFDEKSTAECRGPADSCDLAEACDGATNDCPTDDFMLLGGESCVDHQECCFGYCDDINECAPITNPIIPTSQNLCYSNSGTMICPTFPCQSDGSPAFCGQDSQYPEHTRTFTVSDAGGERLVEDSLTGLMWQGCVVGNSGFNCALGGALVMDWTAAVSQCDSLSYGGFDDWRIPNPWELADLYDYSPTTPAVSGSAFPNTPNQKYWSALTFINDPSKKWAGVKGSVYQYNNAGLYYVRCVRRDPLVPPAPDRFKVTGLPGAEIVLDKATALIWQQEYSTDLTWTGALAYCEGLNFGGFDDWRLPDISELRSLVNYDLYAPASDFPNMPFGSTDSIFASSTTGSVSTAFWVYFLEGKVHQTSKANFRSARCVRGGP